MIPMRDTLFNVIASYRRVPTILLDNVRKKVLPATDEKPLIVPPKWWPSAVYICVFHYPNMKDIFP